MKILIIEPDYILNKIYKQFLSREGHMVVSCYNAQSAVFAVDVEIPHLIILELQLVSHSGIEFLYELRSYKEWQEIPVIIHSSVPKEEFADSWIILQNELGVTNYLYKEETSLEELRRAVISCSMVNTK